MTKPTVLIPNESSPPGVRSAPISTDELRAHLRLPVFSPPNAEEDVYLQMLLDVALVEAEAKQNRDLIARQWTLRVYPPIETEIRLRAECQRIDQVLAYDSDGVASTVDSADYYLDAASSSLIFTEIPSVDRYLEIIFTTRTLDPFPEHVRYGILLLAGWWYQQRVPIVEKSTTQVPLEYPFAVSHLLRKGAWPSAAVL